ncbi:MAG TPA: hypothetical protein VGQ36_20015 [Thermoanaerobaculia bacterium]|nr:hypothetical protein [Thermoanaerobaculia bacterium]
MTRITLAIGFVLCLLAVPLVGQNAPEDVPRLEVQSLTLGLRYRMLENHLGSRFQNWSDHHQCLKLRLKLDRAARYSLTAVAFNGDSFQASWNLRGLQDGQSSNRVFLKQLFVTGKPHSGVEFQYGGLPIVRGESSEITSYDNDGYVMGQRLALSPKRVVDELTVTAGHLGDFRTPSVTRRLHRLSEINYRQLLVKKKLSDRLTATADFTDEDGERTLRQGVAFRPARGIDLIRIEAYERVSGSRGAGGAITAEKPFGRTRIAASFASVDDRYRPVNGDRYGRGQRISLTSTTALSRDLSLQVFVTHALDDDLVMANRTRMDVHIRYELAALLRQMAGD